MSIKIKIIEDAGKQLVSARELHNFLEVQTQFTDWAKRMFEYGFTENQDFEAITQKRVTAQGNKTTYRDYALTLDAAKEISMIQRTEKGKEARQYFLEIEKKYKQVLLDQLAALQTESSDKHNWTNEELATELGITVDQLIAILYDRGLQFCNKFGVLVLYRPFIGLGLVHTHPISGGQSMLTNLGWTAKGRQWIHDMVHKGIDAWYILYPPKPRKKKGIALLSDLPLVQKMPKIEINFSIC